MDEEAYAKLLEDTKQSRELNSSINLNFEQARMSQKQAVENCRLLEDQLKLKENQIFNLKWENNSHIKRLEEQLRNYEAKTPAKSSEEAQVFALTKEISRLEKEVSDLNSKLNEAL